MFTNRIKVFKDSQSRWNFLGWNFNQWCFLPGFARSRPLRAKTATFANPGWADDWQGEAFFKDSKGFCMIGLCKGRGEGEGGGRGGHEEGESDQVWLDWRSADEVKPFGGSWSHFDDQVSFEHLGYDAVPPFDLGHWADGNMAGQSKHYWPEENQSGHKMTENNQGLMVITACNIITGLSALSMSAISTNGQIAAGGVYYMISRFLEKVFDGKKFTANFNDLLQGSWSSYWWVDWDHVHCE